MQRNKNRNKARAKKVRQANERAKESSKDPSKESSKEPSKDHPTSPPGSKMALQIADPSERLASPSSIMAMSDASSNPVLATSTDMSTMDSCSKISSTATPAYDESPSKHTPACQAASLLESQSVFSNDASHSAVLTTTTTHPRLDTHEASHRQESASSANSPSASADASIGSTLEDCITDPISAALDASTANLDDAAPTTSISEGAIDDQSPQEHALGKSDADDTTAVNNDFNQSLFVPLLDCDVSGNETSSKAASDAGSTEHSTRSDLDECTISFNATDSSVACSSPTLLATAVVNDAPSSFSTLCGVTENLHKDALTSQHSLDRLCSTIESYNATKPSVQYEEGMDLSMDTITDLSAEWTPLENGTPVSLSSPERSAMLLATVAASNQEAAHLNTDSPLSPTVEVVDKDQSSNRHLSNPTSEFSEYWSIIDKAVALIGPLEQKFLGRPLSFPQSVLCVLFVLMPFCLFFGPLLLTLAFTYHFSPKSIKSMIQAFAKNTESKILRLLDN
ncbi:hypothetical protein BSLG_000342 [Batrachochytrium salamandrivorans]|nr:hypothetical protein BASA60_004239 [Batrachochytrium salamandrivorans]KAJ1344827.1 hypothetical protein BSLG_000342 [Batrachochytrium salamandrivorans]